MANAHSIDDSTRPGTQMFLLLSALAVSTASATADEATLFSSDQLMEATIEAPFREIMQKRREEPELEGVFTYKNRDGTQQKLELKVRQRGEFRARRDICDFTPLRLNFRKKQVANTEFAGQDKLKLVTHCENSGTEPEQLVLKEYLTYRFLAAMTERSFSTRLLKVTYVDNKRKTKPRTKYAFLVEDKENLAKRIGAVLAKVEPVRYERLNPTQTNLISVFSYFIGNTDFSADRGESKGFCCHNIILFETEPDNILPIPYDFDFSGVVDAPYAAPNPRFSIKSVTTRLYRGLCRNNAALDETFERFHDRRDEIYSLIADLDGLTSKSRRKMTRFVDEFYETIADEKRVNRKLVKKCS